MKKYLYSIVLFSIFSAVLGVVYILYVQVPPVNNAIITNVTGTSFSLVWQTNRKTESVVTLLDNENSQQFFDDRDYIEQSDGTQELAPNKYYTHHVTVSKLSPESSYRFQIQEYEDTITTGKLFDAVTIPNPVYGRVVDFDDNPIEKGVVLVEVLAGDDTILQSGVVSENGTYSIDISQTRTDDLSRIITPLEIEYEAIRVMSYPYKDKTIVVSSDEDQPVEDINFLGSKFQSVVDRIVFDASASPCFGTWEVDCGGGVNHCENRGAHQHGFLTVHGDETPDGYKRAEEAWMEEACTVSESTNNCGEPDTPSLCPANMGAGGPVAPEQKIGSTVSPGNTTVAKTTALPQESKVVPVSSSSGTLSCPRIGVNGTNFPHSGYENMVYKKIRDYGGKWFLGLADGTGDVEKIAHNIVTANEYGVTTVVRVCWGNIENWNCPDEFQDPVEYTKFIQAIADEVKDSAGNPIQFWAIAGHNEGNGQENVKSHAGDSTRSRLPIGAREFMEYVVNNVNRSNVKLMSPVLDIHFDTGSGQTYTAYLAELQKSSAFSKLDAVGVNVYRDSQRIGNRLDGVSVNKPLFITETGPLETADFQNFKQDYHDLLQRSNVQAALLYKPGIVDDTNNLESRHWGNASSATDKLNELLADCTPVGVGANSQQAILENNVLNQVSAQSVEQFDSLGRGVYEVSGVDLTTKNIQIEQNEISVLLFDDSNGNGLQDEGEQFLDPSESRRYSISFSKLADIEAYRLNNGWNLLSFPLLMQGDSTSQITKASDLLEEITIQGGQATQIVTYRGGEFVVLSRRTDLSGGDISFGNDFHIIPGEGYFIRHYGSTVTKLAGKVPETSVAIELEPGWNLRSFYKTGSDQLQGQNTLVKMNEQEIPVSVISKWGNGQYTNMVYSQGKLYGNDYLLYPHLGYWLKLEGDTVKYYSP